MKFDASDILWFLSNSMAVYFYGFYQFLTHLALYGENVRNLV